MHKITSRFIGALLSAAMLAGTQAWAGNPTVYKITVTNLTPGQPFAPVMVASHRPGLLFFKVGEAPSDELAMLAEAGNGSPIAASLLETHGVRDAKVSTEGLTFPGQSSSMTISVSNDSDHISVAAMLGATNDAFFAVRDVALPKGRRAVIYQADAYDAGSETNDELCSTVPGCGGGPAGYSPDDAGEGFVHIHSGIHGIGDLNASTMDWNNPVAQIVIERIR